MLTFLTFLLLSIATLLPDSGVDASIDVSLIRYGKYSEFSAERGDSVAVVDSKKVYLAIPERQTIIREGVKKGTARYYKLTRICTDKYKKAIKAAAAGYVLVVEIGGVKDYKTTDITDNIINNL